MPPWPPPPPRPPLATALMGYIFRDSQNYMGSGEHIPRSMERLWQTVTYVGELIVVAESILLGQRQQVLFENWNVIHFILLPLEKRANARSN